MLNAEQIESFKRDGYLILRSVIEPVYIDAWRRAFWELVGGTLDDPASWKNKLYVLENYKLDPELALNAHPKVRAVVEQLGGGHFGGGGCQPLVHWPSARNDWSPTPWGHVDAYPPSGWYPFMLAATAYAYDVEPMGGGFTYWPQSHHSTHKHFLAHPEMIDGQFSREPGFNWGGPNDFTRIAPMPSREFTARAGDVIFWHAFLVHTGSSNIRTVPRVGFFSRYTHKNQDAIKYEIPQNLWKYWAI